MNPENEMEEGSRYALSNLQKLAMSIMSVLAVITFLGANLQAIFWQSSDWLVSTVLPAVVVDLTNDERAENSAQPLRRNSTLDAAAKMKAEHMAKNEYFSHFSPAGVSPWHWFDEAGYVYAHAGENLAIHFTDSSEVVEAWMKSPTHRQNIVSGLYTEIGVGTAKGKYEGYDTVYVVQLFGAPAVVPVVKEPESTEVAVAEPAPTPAVVTPAVTEIASEASLEGVEILPEVAGELALSNVSSEVVLESELESEAVADDSLEILVENETQLPQPVFEINEAESVVVPEADIAPQQISVDDDVVVVESPIISTSSGLAVAQITTPNDGHAGATVASVATQPNLLLQSVYMVLGVLVLILLSISIVMEARRFHYMQVAYGFMLLFGMGGLWFVHTLLTSGAVIV
ncbi:hypothetical protein KC926_02010 [Candidatus Kaiserbacteria bacterium]|nr:hypothetical protein [Candidatus Kaiserbacteria bacterium]